MELEPPSAHERQRIVKVAIFNCEIGPVSARELLAMPKTQWGSLRDRITEDRNDPDGFRCICGSCGEPVYIQARRVMGQPFPLFHHFKEAGVACPWRHGANSDPDRIRAGQYAGQQESALHRYLCERIDEMARSDSRYVQSRVNGYHYSSRQGRGRYPDVKVKWRDFPTLAFEVQLSKTLQTEISDRVRFYREEGVALLWVVYGFEDWRRGNSQCFDDLLRQHRGNAFVIDKRSMAAARSRKTVVLNCYMRREDGGYDPPRLVTLDDIRFPDRGHPYFEDRINDPMLRRFHAERAPYSAFFEAYPCWEHWGLPSPQGAAFIAERCAASPAFKAIIASSEVQSKEFIRLLAIAMTLYANADGRERNYVTQQPNMTGMLNSMLNRADMKPFAGLFEGFLQRTRFAHLLDGSVGNHIARAKHAINAPPSPETERQRKFIEALFPEVFDRSVRDQLRYYGKLPQWAMTCPVPVVRNSAVNSLGSVCQLVSA